MDFEEAARQAFCRGPAAWPGVALELPQFLAWARGVGVEADQLVAQPTDLYLAAACAAGDPAALALFERAYLSALTRTVGRVALTPRADR